jgi:hypothetical protein
LTTTLSLAVFGYFDESDVGINSKERTRSDILALGKAAGFKFGVHLHTLNREMLFVLRCHFWRLLWSRGIAGRERFVFDRGCSVVLI